MNDGPFYIGGDKWNIGSLLYLDDLTFYNVALQCILI